MHLVHTSHICVCLHTHAQTHRHTHFLFFFKLGRRHYLVFTLLGLIQSRLFPGVHKDALGRRQQRAGRDTLHNLAAGEKWQNIALVKITEGQVHCTVLVRR